MTIDVRGESRIPHPVTLAHRAERARPATVAARSRAGCEAGAGHGSILCGNVRTVKEFASITDRNGSCGLRQRAASAANLERRCKSWLLRPPFCRGNRASNLPSQRKLIREHNNSPCHRVCRRSLADAALRWRNGDRDNVWSRDGGKRKHGRNQFSVASHPACRRTGHRPFLGNLWKGIWHAVALPDTWQALPVSSRR